MLLNNQVKQTSFYSVLYDRIPENHILKLIEKAVDFSFMRQGTVACLASIAENEKRYLTEKRQTTVPPVFLLVQVPLDIVLKNG